jgi:hypothetical protein
MAGQDYAAACSKTIKSKGGKDGWVLESNEGSDAGGTIDSADLKFRLGDEAADEQYRTILSFDTGTIPDNAVLDTVTVKIKKSSGVGLNPFNVLGNILADVEYGNFGTEVLEAIDFDDAACAIGALTFTNTPSNDWYAQDMLADDFDCVKLTGNTQVRLYFETDDNDNLSADYKDFHSGDATSSKRPKIVVTYHAP